ncbi:MAG: hypothetical protein IKN38_06620 [Clostridia bacterium]|nr:hypothetical protein [Clostridia bacterium]
MADKTGKKKRRRRSYLADFTKDATGNYRYTGTVYKFDGGDDERRRLFVTLGALTVLSVALATAQEFLPGTKMNNTFYVILPWLFQFLSSITVTWAYVRTAYGGANLREYIYKASAKKLSAATAILAGACFATVLAEIIFICINGIGQQAWAVILRPSLSLVNGIVSVLLHLLVKRNLRYRK